MDDKIINKPPIAIQIGKCKDCGKDFPQYPENKNTAQYFRCNDCSGEKFLIKAFINSCTIS